MPGKYLEYIKAGRYVVPVEIVFLQASITDLITKKEEFSSKWADRNDWKEIKTLLKPGVEGCLKYNDVLPEKVPKSTHIAFGQEIGLGYALVFNKDKSPFLTVLDTKKNCWTDDEDEEVDENSGFQNFGGLFKSFTPTKLYLRVVVVKKTFSTSDDGKRIQKYMGGKNEDIRQYYQLMSSSNNQVDSSTELNPSSKDKNSTKHSYRETIIHKAVDDNARDLTDNIPRSKEFRTNIENNQREFPIGNELGIRRTDIIHHGNNNRLPITNRNQCSMNTNNNNNNNDPYWKNIRDNVDDESYFEKDEDEEDQDFEEELKSYPEHNIPVPFFCDGVIDEDDDSFILPDIPDTPVELRESEKVEKKYSSSNESKRKQQKSPSSSGGDGHHTPLDFTNILRPTTNSTTISKPTLPSNEINIQKRKNHHLDQGGTSFSDSLINPVDIHIRTDKIQRKISKKMKLNKEKLSKDKKRSSPEKSISPSRKMSPTSLLLSPTKSGIIKIPKISKKRKEKSLKLPVYFNKKSNGIEKGGIKLLGKDSVVIKRQILSPNKTILSSPPKKRPTRLKNQNRRKDILTLTLDPDPEMPVLQKMVYYTVPTAPCSPIRLPKIEPIILREEPITTTQIVLNQNQQQPENPTIEKPPPKKIIKMKQKLKNKKKDEQTQTCSDKILETLTLHDLPTQGITAAVASSSAAAAAAAPPPQIISEIITNNNHNEPQLSLSPPTTETLVPVFPTKLENMIIKPKENSSTTAVNFISIDSEDEDEEANLFSFEHLSKCCMTSPLSKIGTTPSSSTSTSTSTSTTSNPTEVILPLVAPVLPIQNIMPPPVKRPPRTPKKIPPEAIVLPNNSIVSLNSNETRPLVVNPVVGTTTTTTNPSSMSTYQLITNKNTLLAGFGLLNQLASKKLNAEQVGVRLGLHEEKRERSVSPDICLGPINRTTNTRRQKPVDFFESRLSKSKKRHLRKGRGRTISVNLEDNDINNPDRQGGEAFFRELISRCDNTQFRYEPQGDEFDLSQSSFCMVNIYPKYEQQSRTYKMHSKNISELSVEAVTEHFNTISSQLRDIFAEELPSERHQLFLEGQKKRKVLKELNVSVPFDHNHGMALMNLLGDLLVPNPLDRPMWTDYINFVMLPEAFIRIYAHVNQISYKRADTEMRFGACYDDDPIHQ